MGLIKPLVQELVLESEMTKLLLHNIPTSVNSDELHKVVPGDYTIELKSSKKVQGDKYSALAIFNNPQEAHDAYESVEGSQEKDSSGRPQKLVTFRLSTGVIATLYVRKMAPGGPHGLIPSKRALQVDGTFVVCKKVKNDHKMDGSAMTASNQCDVENESLRQQLKQKDFEICMLNKMVSSLRRGTKKNDVAMTLD